MVLVISNPQSPLVDVISMIGWMQKYVCVLILAGIELIFLSVAAVFLI